MGIYVSKYDTQPLPDPGDGAKDGASAASSANPVSKSLVLNWTSPQPLQTVPPPSPLDTGGGDDGGDGGKGGGSGSGSGKGLPQKNPLIGKIPTWDQLQGSLHAAAGPTYETVEVRPDELLNYEQLLLNAASTVVQTFDALVTSSEAAMTADFWGMNEGTVISDADNANNAKAIDHGGVVKNTPHFTASASANSTREFVASLRNNQRDTLQHTADMVTLTGGFIELLNGSADAYSQGDQYSVFPSKSAVTGPTGGGNGNKTG